MATSPTARSIKVGVYSLEPEARGFIAYTRRWNLTYPDVCLHTVESTNGTEAKKAAIREHRAQCMAGRP